MVSSKNLPLILLHGALGTEQQFDKLVPKLTQEGSIHRFNFEGHGQAGSLEGPLKMDYFVENVLGYMQEHNLPKANFFGYSMGGYVALLLAKENPEKVNKIATLGTIFQWNPAVAERESRYLYPEKIKEKVPDFAERLANLHPDGWELLVEKTREMLLKLGHSPKIKEEDWKSLDLAVRLHIGDQDNTADLAVTISVFKQLQNAELCVLPGTPHFIEKVDFSLLAQSLASFFSEQ